MVPFYVKWMLVTILNERERIYMYYFMSYYLFCTLYKEINYTLLIEIFFISITVQFLPS